MCRAQIVGDMMSVQTVDYKAYQNYESVLVAIVRTLPLHRVEQLVDFARFFGSAAVN
jgi:hypothetical protein